MDLIVRHDSREATVSIERFDRHFDVNVEGRRYLVDLATTGPLERSLVIDGQQHEVTIEPQGGGLYRVTSASGLDDIEVLDFLTRLAERCEGQAETRRTDRVKAYMPGRVVTLLVEVGQTVSAGEGILVLEAMKMENEVQAERDGVVREFFVSSGQAVESGDPLYELV